MVTSFGPTERGGRLGHYRQKAGKLQRKRLRGIRVDHEVLKLPLSYRNKSALSVNELKGLGHWLDNQHRMIRRSCSSAPEASGRLPNNLKKSGRPFKGRSATPGSNRFGRD